MKAANPLPLETGKPSKNEIHEYEEENPSFNESDELPYKEID
jgi:hypothetical protein